VTCQRRQLKRIISPTTSRKESENPTDLRLAKNKWDGKNGLFRALLGCRQLRNTPSNKTNSWLGGGFTHLDEYFSNGLVQPPTSWFHLKIDGLPKKDLGTDH